MRLGYGDKERRLAEKTLQTYEIPGSMRSRITRASMLAWIASYRKGGYRIEALCAKKAYLMAIIDDHSRLIIFARFYLSEDFATLKEALREAVSRRGIPQKFYVDNGACYRSEDLERILACLGTALSHSRPYEPQGRGKVERWFKNIRDSFLPILSRKLMTLDDLNERLDEFVSGYNNAEHSKYRNDSVRTL